MTQTQRQYDDKAGAQYWDAVWDYDQIPDPIDPEDPALDNYFNQRLHAYFKNIFQEIAPAPEKQSIIEIGCGGSRWLPYFQKQFGFQISGIDYAPQGSNLAQKILEKADLKGDIFQGDLFAPSEELKNKFDIVFSNGLVEHFKPTESVIMAMKEFVKPGGYFITFIPNMRALQGFLQKHLNPSVYDIHVPMNKKELIEAHEKSGLKIINACYLGSINLGAVNLSNHHFFGMPPSVWYRSAALVTKPVWILEKLGLPEFANPVTSPYIACVAKKE